jgi:chaperonin GroEL (HSP60 family)
MAADLFVCHSSKDKEFADYQDLSYEKSATSKGASEAPKPKKQTTPRPKQQPASGEEKSDQKSPKKENQSKKETQSKKEESLKRDRVFKPEERICRYLLYDNVISTLDGIPAIEEMDAGRLRLIIIAKDFEGDAAEFLKGATYKGLSILGLKAPGYGDRQKAVLQDIAICTGSILISEEMGYRLENTKLSQLGRSISIRIKHKVKPGPTSPIQYYWHGSDFNTILMGSSAKPKTLQDYLKELKVRMKRTTSDYDKENLQIRLKSFQKIEHSPYFGLGDVSDYLFEYKA